MAGKLRIGLLISSTRENRLADRVVKLIKNQIGSTHDVEVFDPTKLDLPQTQQSMNFLFNPSAVPQNIKDLNERFSKLDALLVACAEYNWSIPPGLTNMLDNIPPTTLCWKPVGYVCYSISPLGGARVAVQLRTFTGGLGMVTVPVQCLIPSAHETITTEGTTKNEEVTRDLGSVLNHLYWGANALKSYKKKTPNPDWNPS